MGENIKFYALVRLFHHISTSRTAQIKRTKFRRFLDSYCVKPTDYFPSIRLILPSLDRERGSYGLKEASLALLLLDALAVSRDSEDAQKLINWRKGGSRIAGKYAGNFSMVAAEFLQRRQSSVSGELTIREVNDLLDRLANADTRNAKVDVLGEMIRKTNPSEMKWIIVIILKELKIGMTEKSIFDVFHPDAEELFNVTCDLRLVCEKLTDPKVRHKRQDIEVGKAVKPQMAERAASCGEAMKRLHRKEVVAEVKFDGERFQVHKNGGKVKFYSKNYKDHSEYEPAMSNVIIENVLVDKCILDGELLGWDSSRNKFTKFGLNQEMAKAAREGIESDRKLCYVAFDVLYVGDTSVIHQTLKERHEHLRKVVRTVKGRLETSVPNANRGDGEPCWSIVANHVDDVERFFKEKVGNEGEEGIVIKDLGSKWEPGDRNKKKWVKVKPDYVNAGSDLDVLIIGGYYGSGRQGGEVGQFLVGLAERLTPGTYPRRFVSFARVGTGLTDEERDELVTKLKPYFRKSEKKSAPSFYEVTNKEKPDVWVESPEKSVIMSISSDIRPILSDVYAAPYSLRFPRFDWVRYDKPWHECLDVQSFLEIIQSSGTTRRGGAEGFSDGKSKRGRAAIKGGRLNVTVPSHFTRTDVSSVKGESQIFSNKVFYFVNVPSDHSLDSMHKLAVENGGTFSMNLNDTVTLCIGAESRGIKYEVTKSRGCDIIHYSWVLDCCSQKQLLPLRPKHFVFLSDSSRKKLQEEIDEFSDSYFWDVDVAELKQTFGNVNRSEDAKMVDHYKKKYCPCEKWGRFHGCCIYFYLCAKSHCSNWDIFLKIATRRMKAEVSVGGGKVCDNLSQATHIVVMSIPGHELKFETLLQSFPGDQKYILRRKRLHVIGSQWLEDCLKEGQKLPEVAYNLKPTTYEESTSEEEKGGDENVYGKHPTSSAHEEKSSESVLETIPHIREPRRKRGRPVGTSTKKSKTVVSKPPVTKRARVGSKPAKLQEIAFDNESHKTSKQEADAPVAASPEHKMHDHVFQGIAFDHKPAKQDTDTLEKSGLETENIGLGSRHGLSSSNEESKEENKTDELMKASPEHELDDKPSHRKTNATGKFGLEKNEENTVEHKPDLNATGTHCLDNAGSVTCSKPDKDSDYSTSGMLLDLIPSLKRLSEDANVNLPSTLTQEDSSMESPTGEPVKKKKVSYRELAKQLLKD
ncbi:DNA ligase 4-like [Chenopodium quinoa]|uniref:DNA ligase 4 n=1 Tax=Chenopodium quinoa TaxID=63459 RepID=A0A803KMB9_CHEQI|nr:DNA ligase 4-like [Chenopodium quinoa]